MDKDKVKDLEAVIRGIDKKHGKGTVMRLGETAKEVVPVIPTSSDVINIATGIGGFPRGRLVELYGPESSGKTSLCLDVIKNAQEMGELCAFVDAEHALDPEWAKTLGADVDNLFVSQPANGEQALDITDGLVSSKKLGVIAIDSVAALVPQAELEGDYGDAHMALQARMMSQAMRKLTAVVAKSNCCVIFINQLRHKIGGYGNKEVTTGGNALKFYASMRIDVRKTDPVKKGEDILGHHIKLKVVKNKLAPPFKIGIASFYYDRGFDNVMDIIPEAVQCGIIVQSGSWFSYKEERLGQGAENAGGFLKDNPEMFKDIRVQVYESLGIPGYSSKPAGEKVVE